MLIDVALYRDACRVSVPDLAAAAEQVRAGDGYVWVGLHDPTAEELDEVATVFGLHPLAVEDALKAKQRPKAERYGDSLFVVMKTAQYLDEPEEVEFGEIQMFVATTYIVVIRHGNPVPLTGVRAAVEAEPTLLAAGPAAVLYAVIDAVVDHYGLVLEGLDDDVNEVELEVFENLPADRNPAERIYFLKREVLEFHRSLVPLVSAVASLRADPLVLGSPGLGDYFRDVHDHLLRLADGLQTVRELLVAALGANATQVSLRQNEDMRRISAWVAIVAVPTMIAGIYGMNFEHMPELQSQFGYPLVLGVMFGACAILYRLFRRSGWFVSTPARSDLGTNLASRTTTVASAAKSADDRVLASADMETCPPVATTTDRS